MQPLTPRNPSKPVSSPIFKDQHKYKAFGIKIKLFVWPSLAFITKYALNCFHKSARLSKESVNCASLHNFRGGEHPIQINVNGVSFFSDVQLF